MIVAVQFPDNIDAFQAETLVRDALSNFVLIRCRPSIETCVAEEYPAPDFSDLFRANKVACRKRRIEWAESARVMSFDEALASSGP